MPPLKSKFREGDPSEDPEKDTQLPLTETIAPPPVEPVPSQRQAWNTTQPPSVSEPAIPPAEATPAPQSTSPISTLLSKPTVHLYTVSYLIFFAILGTLARLGLQALTFYTGAPLITAVLWANVTGSLVMGFLIEDKNLFCENAASKKSIPLYIGLTTGFCGCCTSFSSFMRDTFLALANILPQPDSSSYSRNGGYSFMALTAVLILTVSASLSALIFGAHTALALSRFTPSVSTSFRRVLDPAMLFLGWGCWLGAVFLAIWPPDRHGEEHWRGRAVFAIVFAPLGCLARFYVSLLLNTRVPSFPLGTFTVNIFGTLVEAMCFDLQRVDSLGAGSLVSCQVLQGVMDGFCGSLTTVSSWVAELNGLAKRRQAYFYGVCSVAVGLGVMVVVSGSLLWTRGFDEPVCG